MTQRTSPDHARVLYVAASLAALGIMSLLGCRWQGISRSDTSADSPPGERLSASFDSRFNRYEMGHAFDGDTSVTWEQKAWRGDRVHQQVVLWSDTPLSGLSYELSDLEAATGSIVASSLQLRFLQYVKGDPEARNCDGYAQRTEVVELADALSTTPAVKLSPQDPIKAWLTIDVPADAVAGLYTGELRVAADGVAAVHLAIRLQVLPLQLPAPLEWDFHLDLWQFPAASAQLHNRTHADAPIELWSDQHLSMLKPSYRRLADAGQKAISTYIKGGAMGAPSMVGWIRQADETTWVYDYSGFDRVVEAHLRWGISQQINAFSVVGWNKDEIPYRDESTGTDSVLQAPIGSAQYTERWRHFLTDFRTHLLQKGWFDKLVLYMDEVPEEEMQAVISLIREHDADWRIGLAYGHQPSAATLASLYDASGILAATAGVANPDDRIRTFYTSCTQTHPNSYLTRNNSPAEMTWLAWHAQQQGLDGFLRWAYDYWRLEDPLDLGDGQFTAGDFSLVYRSSNDASMQSLSSVRFELLREGIQDFEKLRILRRKLVGAQHAATVALLNAKVAEFTATSGLSGDAERLVASGQALLSHAATLVSDRPLQSD